VLDFSVIPNSERFYVVSADLHSIIELSLNEIIRVSAPKNFEFGIAVDILSIFG
jgi:hypothetical protein